MKLATLLLAVASALSFGQTLPTTRPLPFEIGAWQVPVEDVAKWQARGVNTFFGHVDYGGRMSKAEWERRVGDAAGRFVTYPGEYVIEEGKQRARAGFMQLDEPDLSSHVDKPGYTPPEFRQQWERGSGTGLPVYLTAGAMDNLYYDGRPKPLKTDGSKYGHRAENFGWFAWCDVAGFDFYLYTHGRTEAVGFPVIERCLDRCHEWSGGKPIYLFVETCTQGKPYAMTADQWEAQVMHAANYCRAKGYRLQAVVYFSHIVFPIWKAFDGTSAEVSDRMPAVNARLRSMFGGAVPPPPTTQPVPSDPIPDAIAGIRAELDATRQQAAELKATVNDLATRQQARDDDWTRLRQALTTQPTTQGVR